MASVVAQEHCQDLKSIFEAGYLRDIPRRGIIHIGADIGQEVPQYFEYGFEKIILIEANPDKYDILQARFGRQENITLLNYAICDKEGTIDFHIHTSRTGSTEPASILPMKRFKDIVKTLHTADTIRVPAITLDLLTEAHDVALGEYNFINIDIQGAELLALRSATRVMPFIDAIISEVNLIEMYENGALENDVVAFLASQGFEKCHAVYHALSDENSTFPAWGECLFVKRDMTQSAKMQSADR
jgi:FkbM family methyltransferase